MRSGLVAGTAGIVVTLAVAGCGSATVNDVKDATTFWRQQLANHYHAQPSNHDGRGCLRSGRSSFWCLSFVAGRNVIGTVHVGGTTMRVVAHAATNTQANAWLHRKHAYLP